MRILIRRTGVVEPWHPALGVAFPSGIRNHGASLSSSEGIALRAGGRLSHVGTSAPFTKVKSDAKLHLGCGTITPDGWINVDGSWNARLAKHPLLRKMLAAASILSRDQSHVPWNPKIITRDVRRPLPYSADSFDAIYASHLLEHLYLDEGRRLLRECFRTLRPGGVLRMVVPDLRAAVQACGLPEFQTFTQRAGHAAGKYLRQNLYGLERFPLPQMDVRRAFTLR